jgi:hypothetical protein
MTPPSSPPGLTLPQVTLVAASSVAIAATVRALRLSQAQVTFGRVVLLSHLEPAGLKEAGIEWREIAPLWSRKAYSHFMLHELVDFIDTDFVLVSQWDGHVLDGRRWNAAFLAHDYIGAAWPQFGDGLDVGNGGFSLRSKRLLEATRRIDPGDEAEDTAICRTHRKMLETQHGISFAPRELARSFSFERGEPAGATFGFHGVFNMASSMAPDAFIALLKTVEPGVIGRKEAKEILIDALRRRHGPLISAALRHYLAQTRLFGSPLQRPPAVDHEITARSRQGSRVRTP